MFVTYDIEKINAALEDFYKATDININLLDSNFSYIGGRAHRENNLYCQCVQNNRIGLKGCRQSDEILLKKCKDTKKLQIRVCHAGLTDAAAPILYENDIIGYVIFGEMKPEQSFDKYAKHIEKMGLDADKMKEYYLSIQSFDSEKIKGIANIASMLVRHLLLEKMLTPNYDMIIEKAVSYIDEHIADELSIYILSKGINVSKSVLYKRFHRKFNTTVSEYINKRRIEKSIGLLKSSDLSIEEISQRVGFSSASYYSKTFKSLIGKSPLKYKKETFFNKRINNL